MDTSERSAIPVSNPASPPPKTGGAGTVKPRVATDERVFLAIVAAGVLGIACVALFVLTRETPVKRDPLNVPDRRLMDFTLTDRTGQVVRRADLQDQFLVVNFVFTACSLECLQVNYRMAEIQSLVANQPDVRLVSLSVDPKSDTPPMLARFADRFGAQTNRWLFLTGDKRVIFPLIETSLLGPPDETKPGIIPGEFIHSDEIALVDKTGRLRGLFDGLKPDAASQVMEALASLRRGPATE